MTNTTSISLLFLLLLALGGGCAPSPNLNASHNFSKTINVPFVAQDKYQCGPAAIEMLFRHMGNNSPSSTIVKEVYSPNSKGSIQPSLIAVGRRHGYISHEISGFDELLSELSLGRPVIILQNLAFSFWPKWHYAVVIGFDYDDDKFILHSGANKSLRMPTNVFKSVWDRAGNWGLMFLLPGELPKKTEPNKWASELIAFERLNPQLEHIYDTSIQRWPQNILLLTAYANRRYMVGDLTVAERTYKAILEIDSAFVPVLNNLADLLLHSGRLLEARDYAMKAMEIGGSHSVVAFQTLKEIEAEIGLKN